MDLNGAVSIVTGGSGGLGGRICRALAGAGSDVAVLYAGRRDAAERGPVAARAVQPHQARTLRFKQAPMGKVANRGNGVSMGDSPCR